MRTDSPQAALPNGWRTAHVGDILTVRNGFAVKSSYYCEDGVPLIRQSDISGNTIDISAAKRVPTRVMEECKGYLVREGDLLIGMSGSLGKIGLAGSGPDAVEIVLTNPPFGKKSSVTIVNEAGDEEKQSLVVHRDDFWASTSNKQLNFLQHVFIILKQHGRAAIVVPDNVLFEGGAGETVRRELLKQADVHTLLRLPTGIFYAQGVKANVLFFDRKPAAEEPWTSKLWIYDLRTNKHFTLKENPLKRSDLDDFVACYNPKNRHERKESERFKGFAYEELTKRDKLNLDIFWLKDESLEDSANLPDPDVIAAEIVEDLQAALAQFAEIAADLRNNRSNT
jgi:type I restriction-modification system DNA methylase subunit